MIVIYGILGAFCGLMSLGFLAAGWDDELRQERGYKGFCAGLAAFFLCLGYYLILFGIRLSESWF